MQEVSERKHDSPRCPHAIYRGVLGPQRVAALLDFVTEREADFERGAAYNRQSREGAVDLRRRDCRRLPRLGPFEAPVDCAVRARVPAALAELHVDERGGEPREFEISAYGDGGHFNLHIDLLENLEHVRILSCVYYFAATPRRFSGGELRLYGLPSRSEAENAEPPFVDVVPETDTLVVFPSWMRHEVLTVRVPSDAWADRRFAINCWVHRVQKAPNT
jgi:Rps23 Pro-64 3,4-dihydroxylase Tpa1-like proline 4-hydroxylase